MLVKLHIENIPKINMNVCFLSYFENTSGMNSPQIAIVNVNELMKHWIGEKIEVDKND